MFTRSLHRLLSEHTETLSQPAYPRVEVATCRGPGQDSPTSKAARKREWQPRKLSCQRGSADKSNRGSCSCKACEQRVACTRLHTCRWAQTRRRRHPKPSLNHHKITSKIESAFARGCDELRCFEALRHTLFRYCAPVVLWALQNLPRKLFRSRHYQLGLLRNLTNSNPFKTLTHLYMAMRILHTLSLAHKCRDQLS